MDADKLQAYRGKRDAARTPEPVPAEPAAATENPDGGMFVWLRLPGEVDTAEVLKKALTHNVAFVPGPPFFATNPDPATFRMSFTTNTPEDITEGMRRLRTTFS